MDIEQFIGSGAVYLALAIFLIVTIFKAVRIVPQSEKYVVERFGRLRSVLGPGINFLVPYLDRVAHKVSVLERQLPNARQDAISADNVLLQVETSVFYRVTEPEKTVYRIRDIDAAIATTVTGIVRSEIGKLELDQVQSNRAQLIERVREQVAAMVDEWGVEVTRAEILDVALDEATRNAMLQQLNAERARRAQVMEAEGKKRAVELGADADLYAADQAAKARRLTADAEAYATGVIAGAIKENGLEAAQFQVALKQVNALEAFGDAFKMLKGRA
jgi:regulator of protease activity HflC (stomatin/prohibitin superfamily)